MPEPAGGVDQLRAQAGEAQAAVIGGGPAGLVAALALAHFRARTVLVARRPDPDRRRGGGGAAPRPGLALGAISSASCDNRTTALIGASIATLEALGVWKLCRSQAAPLRVLRIVDDTARLCRAPQVRFEASEIGIDAFGWNIENVHLVAALWERIAGTPGLAHIDSEARSVAVDEGGVSVTLDNGEALRCALAVGADGANSICRAAAGIALDSRDLAQTALTFTLRHARSHGDGSTEFHTAAGPFTLVPLPGQRSSLVCVLSNREARRFEALSGNGLDLEIERRSHSILGKVHIEPGRGAFPLRVSRARALAAKRVALVGEAAHVLPPIGAQGLNLALRGAAIVAELAGTIARAGGDIGAPAATASYERARWGDAASRMFAVDLLNQSLLSDFLPVQLLRALGLYALGRVGVLRRAAMREGVGPAMAGL